LKLLFVDSVMDSTLLGKFPLTRTSQASNSKMAVMGQSVNYNVVGGSQEDMRQAIMGS
jgi:hypothetical protein